MSGRAGRSVAELVGAFALAVVPVAIATPPAWAATVLAGAPGPLAVPLGVLVGLGGSYALGPILSDRAFERLPAGDDAFAATVTDRVAALADAEAIDSPTVRVVDVDAANVCVRATHDGATLVVSERLRELDAAARDAVLRHAIARSKTGNALLVTALLAPALAVELLTLIGAELANGRDRDDGDERPRVLGVRDEDRGRRSIPPVAYRIGGLVSLLLLAPFWVLFAVGDRLLVGGGRRRADALVARSADAAGLGDALEFARDATGTREWPPTLDRLSVVPMGDPATRRVRGTSRHELRVRIARARSKR